MENIINPPTKFTQEIKDKWLNALKSGKYTQIPYYLENEVKNHHCCIGVLGKITEGLDNVLDESSPYNFLDDTIGHRLKKDLWKLNDSTFDATNPNYSNVISLIEQLPVSE